MNSNSNLEITNYKVDPTSQQISEIYINGEKLETGSEPELQNKSVTISSIDQFDTFATGNYIKVIEPSESYDGLSKATFGVSAALMASNTLHEATLGSNKKILIENIQVNSGNYITAFSGNLYTMWGSSAGIYFAKADYQTSTGPCGGTLSVRVDGEVYTTATLSWN